MDPVTIGAVLAAVAAGTGEALGGQLWAGLSALVCRPFRRAHAGGDRTAALPSGSAELAALEQSPADQRRAMAVAAMLVARADADAGFRDALAAWWEQASQLRIDGDVANTISGGTLFGPVLQGRDLTGLTLGTPASPAPDQSAKCRARSLSALIDIDRSLSSAIRLTKASVFPLNSSRTSWKRNLCCLSSRSEGFEH
jgi:hypothetical protein